MSNMKAYTDLEQSKKLEEILSIESADMCFNISVRKNMPPLMVPYSRFDEFFNISPTPDFLIPCWSLAALLDVIPQVKLDNIKQYDKKYWRCCAYFASDWHNSNWCDNPVDACYEMILNLHELNIL